MLKFRVNRKSEYLRDTNTKIHQKNPINILLYEKNTITFVNSSSISERQQKDKYQISSFPYMNRRLKLTDKSKSIIYFDHPSQIKKLYKHYSGRIFYMNKTSILSDIVELDCCIEQYENIENGKRKMTSNNLDNDLKGERLTITKSNNCRAKLIM